MDRERSANSNSNSKNTSSERGTDLEYPEDPVSWNSPYYIERDLERPYNEADCCEALTKSGALIRIKAPRYMGKTSLMSRILHYASQNGCKAVSISFKPVGGERFANLDHFLQWFCAGVADKLNLPDQLANYWTGDLLFSDRKCNNYFQKYLLPAVKEPLAVGLDDIDQIFYFSEVAQVFFGLLREWHEAAQTETIWQKLRLVLVHSREVYIPLKINQSPFNVGMPIEPQEFNLAQMRDLAQRHNLRLSEDEIRQLREMVGGHPYLVRVAFYQLARQRITLKELLQTAPTEAGLYSNHLRRHFLNLKSDSDLLEAMKQVVIANNPVHLDSDETFKLRSMGLVKLQDNNTVKPSCNLYRQYFGDRL
jgi:AAA-like domain